MDTGGVMRVLIQTTESSRKTILIAAPYWSNTGTSITDL